MEINSNLPMSDSDGKSVKSGRSGRGKKQRMMRPREDHVERTELIDKPSSKWVISISGRFRDNPNDYDTGRFGTVHRAPTNLLRIQEKAFVPKIISIGPFRFRQEGFRVMEQHKMRFLSRLLAYFRLCERHKHQEAASSENGGESQESEGIAEEKEVTFLQVLEREMRMLEKRTRMSYSEDFSIESDDFVQMLIVDGCFIVELLRLYHKFDSPSRESVDDPIFATRWMLRTLQRDLLMLENQLPFFVLKKLYEITSITNDEPSLIELILVFCDPLLPRKGLTLPPTEARITISEPDLKEETEEKYKHILDVFRSTFLNPFEDKAEYSKWTKDDSNIPLVEERQLIHCATELREAGIKFRKRENHHLLDIDFAKGGSLEMPTLNIDDNTVPLLLNFLAYEQCAEDAKPFFTNYFMFLDSLINSPKDVKILHQNGIINHVLGSDEDVANFFNTVCREIVYDLDQCYLVEQMEGVNAFCKAYNETIWNVWWTDLKRKYFSSPWTSLSLAAALLLLVLTTLQTFYTVLPYYHK